MFYKSENSNATKPLDVEKDVFCFFVRKDFVLVNEKTENGQTRPAHWEYLEDKIPLEQWTTYLMAQGAMDFVNAMEG